MDNQVGSDSDGVRSSQHLTVVPSRSAAWGHARTISDQADTQALTLESILAVLRSNRVNDRAARQEATQIASEALVRIRSNAGQKERALLVPVSRAFSQLRTDLRPLVRFGNLDLQFIEPPPSGRALPGDVAQEARSIVRGAVLNLVQSESTQRARVKWDCDGRNLLMEIRDDGDGQVDTHDDAVRPIAERVAAVNGSLEAESTVGWGSVLRISIPLDPPAMTADGDSAEQLTPRERDVLRLVAAGLGNQEIAGSLGVSINTVKFHVANLLRKFGARSRTELVASLVAQGTVSPARPTVRH